MKGGTTNGICVSSPIADHDYHIGSKITTIPGFIPGIFFYSLHITQNNAVFRRFLFTHTDILPTPQTAKITPFPCVVVRCMYSTYIQHGKRNGPVLSPSSDTTPPRK
jgi:hypothetical protein